MLCSHLKISPPCRRFPPQTRGEHLWCRSARDASVVWLFPWHTPTNPIFISSCPWRCHSCRMLPGLHGPPQEPPCHCSQQLPLAAPYPRSPRGLGAEICSQEALVPAGTGLCCDSYKWRDLGRVYNYLYCFFFVLSSCKNLTSA